VQLSGDIQRVQAHRSHFQRAGEDGVVLENGDRRLQAEIRLRRLCLNAELHSQEIDDDPYLGWKVSAAWIKQPGCGFEIGGGHGMLRKWIGQLAAGKRFAGKPVRARLATMCCWTMAPP
jgi:hypothetical protein